MRGARTRRRARRRAGAGAIASRPASIAASAGAAARRGTRPLRNAASACQRSASGIAARAQADRALRPARRDRRPVRGRRRLRGASSIAARRGCVPSASMRRPSGVIASAVERAERRSRSRAAAERAGRRRIDEAQRVAAPRGELQRERGQFDLRDLRAALRFQPLRLRPQAIRPALGDATRAAGALVGGGLRDRRRRPGARSRSWGRNAARAPGRCRSPRARRAASRCDSATLVASTTRRRPSRSAAARAPAVRPATRRAARSTSTSRQASLPASAASTLRDLALAGQEHEHVARMLRERPARSRGAPAASSASSRRAGKCATSTGYAAARAASVAAHRGSARGVRHRASPTSPRCAGPRASRACTSSASARPRSPARWRSWNSSNSSAPTPSSIGSSCSMRVRMPSVTTSIARARRDLALEADAVADRLARRLRRSCFAMKPAAARAATRRGSSITILRPRQPRRVEQGQRHLRGLAGAGRRFEHEPRMRGEARADARGSSGGDGEVAGGVARADSLRRHARPSVKPRRPCHASDRHRRQPHPRQLRPRPRRRAAARARRRRGAA